MSAYVTMIGTMIGFRPYQSWFEVILLLGNAANTQIHPEDFFKFTINAEFINLLQRSRGKQVIIEAYYVPRDKIWHSFTLSEASA